MLKPVSAFVLSAVSKETWAHALGADPTVIERIDAGLMLPFELSPAWVFWLVFGLCIVQNLKGTTFFSSVLPQESSLRLFWAQFPLMSRDLP